MDGGGAYNVIQKKTLMTSQEDALADRSVLTAWTLSSDHLQSQSEEEAYLVLLWAYLWITKTFGMGYLRLR